MMHHKDAQYSNTLASKELHHCWKFDNNNEHEYHIKKILIQ